MQDWARFTGFDFLAASWLPEVLLVLAGVLLLILLAREVLRRIERAASQTSTVWDDALIRSVKRPLTVLLWVVGLAHVAGIFDREIGSHALDYALPARSVGVIACLAWFLIRMINNAALSVLAQSRESGHAVDQTTVDAMSKLGRVIVLIVSALVILQTLGFSVSGVLAFSGIGGIAVGFAAKDLLANFFGGLMIYLDRPFSVGDWIRSPDKAIEGTVEYIGWRQTRIRAFNKNPIYVPNALFTTIVVENPSRMSHRRIKEVIGIRYQDIAKMAAITADVKAMLTAHPDIDNEATMIVNFTTFSASSLDFMIYTFTTMTQWVRYQEIKQDVLLKVAEVIAAHGAEIAFPTRTVHLERE
ncbi:MAG: mechanosensitive ion channel family protein [Gammaproteobacteria bacterium]|nr:mechanosensitive ion channel family protein [Gammaproteobacteria bacterium]